MGQSVGTSGSLAIAKPPPRPYMRDRAPACSSAPMPARHGLPGRTAARKQPGCRPDTHISLTQVPSGVYKTTNAGGNWGAVNGSGLTDPAGGVTSLAINTTSTGSTRPRRAACFLRRTAGPTGRKRSWEIPSTPLLVAVDSGNNVFSLSREAAWRSESVAARTGDWSALTYNGLTRNRILRLAVQPGVSGTVFAGIVAATDAFLTRISPDGHSFASSTCIGGAITTSARISR